MVFGFGPVRGLARNWSLVVVAVALLVQGAFVAWAASSPQRHAVWRSVIPEPIWPAFADLRAVTEAWDETAAGFDPLRIDGDAPRYNYPRLWLLGGNVGGRTADAKWLGVVFAGLFLTAVFAVARIAPGWTRILSLSLVASPAIALGLERGNGDSLIFALVTPALLAGSATERWRQVWPSCLVVLAAMLKLFPILAMPGCVVRRGRTAWISAAAGVLVFGCYLAATRADVVAILAKTERGLEQSYGLTLAADRLKEGDEFKGRPLESKTETRAAEDEDRADQHWNARWIAAGLVLLALGAASYRGRPPGLVGPGKPPSDAAVRLFVAGAAIFLTTFLFAHSWAYRLIFLIWTLPLLGHDLYFGASGRRVWAGATLILITTVCWLVAGASEVGAWWGHLACFALVFPLTFMAASAAMPETEHMSRAAFTSRRAIRFGIAVCVVAGTLAAGTGGASSSERSPAHMAEVWRLMLRGKAAVKEGRTTAAISNFENALRLYPNHADAHAQLGSLLWQAGQSDEALRHLESAISLQPRAIGARNTLAGVRRQQRRWDEAIAGYQESLSIRPDNVPTLNQLGLACLESGNADDAFKWLERAQRIAPDNPTTERNLGLVAAARGRVDEAAGHFNRALQLRPDYADAELQWGFVLARARRLPEALEHFQRAVDLAPTSGQAHFVLAMALRELGRATEAEPHFREAIRLEPALAPR